MLTCYGTRYARGAPYTWATSEPPTPPLVLVASHFDEKRVLQLKGRRAKAVLRRPRRTFLFSANFSFCRGLRVAELAYDPQLPYLFYGEEALMAVRCFTHGWELYTPTRAWAFHLWEKNHRPSYDAKLSGEARALLDASCGRLAKLLGQQDAAVATAASSAAACAQWWPRPNGMAAAPGSSATFGLGDVRTLAAYEAAAGVRFGACELDPEARHGYLAAGDLLSLGDATDAAATEAALAAIAANQPMAVATRSVATLGASDNQPSSTAVPAAASAPLMPLMDEILGSGAGEGGNSGVTIVKDALPATLAHEARALLSALPPSDWEVADTPSQPLSDTAALVGMHYRKNPRADPAALASLKERIGKGLSAHIDVRAHERLLINFSRYDEGDFLDSHGDTPSGSRCYERRRAFVWHLSEGWRAADGGLFIDEEAGGDTGEPAERAIGPSFNTLVSFAVPRMHRVTRVTSARQPRFAVYGWVATPELKRVPDARALRALLAAGDAGDDAAASVVGAVPRAIAVLAVPERPPPEAARLLANFAALPMDAVGSLGHKLGDYCRFVVTRSAESALKVLKKAAAAQRVEASSAPIVAEGACLLYVVPPGVVEAGCEGAGGALKTDAVAMAEASPSALREFIDVARKVWSPCAELDLREPLVMSDYFFSAELKLLVFAAHAARPPALLAKLDQWARALKPHVRIYLAEPALCEPVLEEFGLRAVDAPTVVAYDTAGKFAGSRDCMWRMLDLPGGRRRDGHIDLQVLRQFALLIAKRTSLGVRASGLLPV